MRRILLAGLLALAACSSAQASEAQFRADMIEMFRKAYPGTDFASGGQELEVTVKGGAWEEATINLHRIYLFCQTAVEADCDTISQAGNQA